MTCSRTPTPRHRSSRSDFGADVAELVELVSDDPSIDDEEARKDDVRERVRRAGGFAPVVYGADKVSKVRELRMQLATGLAPRAGRGQAAPSPPLARDARAAGSRDSRIVELLRFELEALERLPPQV